MVDIEPLDSELWFAAVKSLAVRAQDVGNGNMANLLRHSYHLLQLAPRHFTNAVRTQTPEGAFEALLEDGAFEAAARALMAPPATVSLSRPGANLCEACVCLTPGFMPVAQAGTPEAAMLLAWIPCLLALQGREIRQQNESPRQRPHKEQSARHLRVIEH